jgi:hypothetical protein
VGKIPGQKLVHRGRGIGSVDIGNPWAIGTPIHIQHRIFWLQSLAHTAFSLINDAARKSRRRISTLGLGARIITIILKFTVAINNASPFSIGR